jgi:alkylated DNA repair dioxygenase AlkB
MQGDLFSDSVQKQPELLPMRDGKVTFMRDFLTSELANQYFSVLSTSLAWQQDTIKMYGKEVKIPRLQAWYGDKEAVYAYSGITLHPKCWTAELLELKSKCEYAANTQFNSVLLNYYRDGQDSMGWHSDNELELGEQPVIASISLGQARDFDLRHIRSKQKIRLNLTSGSLIIMSGDTQSFWQHAVPKRTAFMTGRINLTFRSINNFT